MRIAVIVQARISSTRLPGKVLKKLGGMSALAQCLRRCAAIPGITDMVCAVPEGPEDEPVAAEARHAGAVVTRGPLQDVLRRYRIAADHVGADIVMRVTSDCPLIDPVLCGRLLGLLTATRADYVCNNMPPSWPHGLDAEAFRADRLREADDRATEAHDREHVTPWLRREPGLIRANVGREGPPLTGHRWTLDYPEDYEFLAALFDKLPPEPPIPSLETVLAILVNHPELAAINAARRDAGR